ncbi:MAG: Stp1/IreP family PP2C-type Ser/Thr phosphatase [Sulfuricella sp.]
MTDMHRFLEMTSLTAPGRVRSQNEDSIACDAEAGFAILADGMGGYNAGEVASGIAVTVLAERLKSAWLTESYDQDSSKLIKTAIEEANAAIYRMAQSQPQCSGMGTTVVFALFHDNRIAVAHVGDSRLYRCRNERLEQITLDHSLLQEQVNLGLVSREDARLSYNKNLVTRALGIEPVVDVEIQAHEVLPGDVYLLCSDGLNDMVDDEEIRHTLNLPELTLELAAQRLVQIANDNGGRDNISVILVRILRDFPADRGLLSRFLTRLKKK